MTSIGSFEVTGCAGKTAAAALVAVAALVSLAGCATPPTGVPTAADIRGLKPSGSVTMTQLFLSGSGVGRGTLVFRRGTYPFTLTGEFIGLGAVPQLDASGEVYNLKSPADFAGAYIQSAPSLAVSGPAAGDLWLKNTNGVIMHLTARQAGLSIGSGRAQIFVTMGP